MTETKTLDGRILAMALPIAEELGLEILELTIASGEPGTVKLTVDRLDADGPKSGVQIGEIAKLSKALDFELESTDLIPFAYRLEVSSPGVERDLKTDRDLTRFRGERVKVVGSEPIHDGHYAVKGRLVGHTDTTVEVALDGGEQLTVDRAVIRKMRNIYDFSAAFSRK